MGGKPADVFNEERGFGDFIRHDVQYPSQAAHAGDCGNALKIGWKLRALRPAGGDCAGNPVVGADHEGGLGLHVALGDVHFHMQRRVDAELFGAGEVVLCGHLAIERGGVLQPGVGEPVLVDEVKMGIDDAHCSSLCPCGRSIFSRRA